MIRDAKLDCSHRIILYTIVALHVSVAFIHHASAQSTSPPSSGGLYYHLDRGRAIILASLIFLFLLIGFTSVYIHKCVRPPTEMPGDSINGSGDWSRRNGLDLAVVESFPIFAYSSVRDVTIGKSALECAICLSDFKNDEMLRLLPKCCHVFHACCIDKWLRSQVTCPVCRARLAAESGGNAARTESNTGAIDRDSSESRDADGGTTNQVAIDVDNDDRTGASAAIEPRAGIFGKFPRSNSTGHSAIPIGECTERYTLRVPEQIRKRIIEDGKIKRVKSYDVVSAAEGCSAIGFKSGSDDGNRGRS